MAGPIVKKLKKGDLLFTEGDASKSMYFVQAGTLRLYKKKGNASIELGMIHKGEVIGEMGFLDGGPRSASAEALHDTDLMEITSASLVEQMKVLPSWLMVLLKTIVNRLRSANNKIRQLESASTSYTYGSEGVSTTYQYLNIYELMKICSGLLITASRNSEKTENGLKISMARIQRYANNVMGVPVAKITELLDIFERISIAKVERISAEKIEVYLKDLDVIESFINFLVDENLKDPTKQIQLTIKAVKLMGFVVKHLDKFPPDAEGTSTVNFAKIIQIEKDANGGKEPFKLDEASIELVKAKIMTEIAFKDAATALSQLKAKDFIRLYRIQMINKEIDVINDKKRQQAAARVAGR